jgi:hydroxymethylbilane synthase
VTDIRSLCVGTRGSALARAQTALVLQALRTPHPALALMPVEIGTQGDRDRQSPLAAIGGTGIFVKELESALLDRRIDIAVHSLKDMPSTLTPGLAIAAVLPRGDARDALVSRTGATLPELPPGARVGTGSNRRRAVLRALRPDLDFVELRGNVDTRIRRVREGVVDAAVLAAAGLERLGRLHEAAQLFAVDELLPAVGQGAIAVEARADDTETLRLLAAIDDPPTRLCVSAERAFLRRLGSGCMIPAAAYATIEAGELRLRALLANGDDEPVRAELRGAPDDAEALGLALAERLLAAVANAR